MAKTVGPYLLLEPLGAGGMGVVYRARDARLGRDVALKLLPPQAFSDPRPRARLVQEAQLASALNHPHICTIYDVGEANNEIYIAMEWIEGEPLSKHIPSRGLPIETVLRYGAQVADALAHAHARGIVHRDLKASNVIITPDGRAKVLDFGIAKRIAAHPDDPTVTHIAPLTEEGSIPGTPGYVAPELLQGEDAGPQSDIWGLGVLLYEMTTGQRPFTGRTPHELAAAILTRPAIPLTQEAPAGLRSLIARCLEKEPGQRLQQAAEARAALETLSAGLHSPIPPADRKPRTRWVAATIAGAAVLAAVASLLLRSTGGHPVLEQRQLTSNPPENPIQYGSLSPDGHYLAVVDFNGLSVRRIDSGDARKIDLPPGYEVIEPLPRVDWYPDQSALLLSGGRIPGDAFSSIWSIPLLGGKPRRLQNDGTLAGIAPDASQIAYVRQQNVGPEIWCMGANGEDPHRLVSADSSGMLPVPVWSPAGHRLIYPRGRIGPEGHHAWIETCDLAGNRRLVFDGIPGQRLAGLTTFVWLRSGRLFFGLSDPAPSQSDMNLWSLKVDPESGKASGRPVRVTQWTRASLIWPSASSADGKKMSVGFIRWQSDCYVAGIAGGDSSLKDVKRLTLDDRMDENPAWTLDGTAILFDSDRTGTLDIFRQALDTNEAEPLVSGPGNQVGPSMSPDGAWILYKDLYPAQGGHSASLMRLPAGGGPPAKVMDMQPGAHFHTSLPPSSLCVVDEMKGAETVFFSFDPVRGRGAELARIEVGSWPVWNLSRDGSAVAVLDARSLPVRIEILSLSGLPKREVILDRTDLQGIVHLAWAPSDRGWILTALLNQRWNLLQVNLDGRSTELLQPQMWMYSSAPSPDGRHVVFTSNTVEANVWLLEHF